MQDMRLGMHPDPSLENRRRTRIVGSGRGAARRRLLALLAAAAPCLVALAGCAVDRNAAAAGFSFALLGDAPYREADEPRFAALLQHIDADPALRFVLHAGDLKGSGEPCSDQLLRRRLAQLAAVRTALVYTPGDNEWTDCHRPAAGRHDPLERLARLRQLAFADPQRSMGRQPLALQPQSATADFPEFVENTLFEYGGVVFAALHVVGSNNGLAPWHGIDPADAAATPRADRLAEFRRREAANLAWLRRAFSLAAQRGAGGVVVLMQANPRFERAAGDRRRAGFEMLIAELQQLARRFGRPVLLAHGDGHVFLVDRPFADAMPPADNLLRVQTYGDPWLGWLRITVDPTHSDLFVVRRGELPAAAP